jgi:hypothetical protein
MISRKKIGLPEKKTVYKIKEKANQLFTFDWLSFVF